MRFFLFLMILSSLFAKSYEEILKEREQLTKQLEKSNSSSNVYREILSVTPPKEKEVESSYQKEAEIISPKKEDNAKKDNTEPTIIIKRKLIDESVM